MRMEFESGEVIDPISPLAVTFTPFGLYLQLPGSERLVPWSVVREVSTVGDDREVRELLRAAEPGSDA